MSTPLLTIALRSKRDVVEARQRGRQLAGLLGLPPAEQLLVSAAVFEVAWSALQSRGHCQLCFQIEDHRLAVFATKLERKKPVSGNRAKKLEAPALMQLLAKLDEPAAPRASELRLEKPLPVSPGTLAVEDIPWAAQELAKQTPLNLFEEIRRQNQELLRLLHELTGKSADAGKRKPDTPSAA